MTHDINYTAGEFHAIIAPLIDVHDTENVVAGIIIGLVHHDDDPPDYVRLRLHSDLNDEERVRHFLIMALHELMYGNYTNPTECQGE